MDGALPEKQDVLYASDHLQIILDMDSEIIFLLWKGSPTEEEVKNGYLQLIKILKKRPIHKFLVDSRARSMDTPIDNNALFNFLFPMVQECISDQLYIASVVPIQDFIENGANFAVEMPVSYDNYTIIINRYTEFNKALDWLSSIH